MVRRAFKPLSLMTIQLFRNYSTTITLTPVYSLGFAVSCFLVIQIISGFFLSMAYIAHTELAFKAIHSYLMRDLDSGWLLRSIHSNGASYFMIFIYAHMFRALFYGSTVKSRVWIVGSIIFLLLCATSFTGYSLVWGQLSLWAVVVICSLVTAIPFIGNTILQTIWGGSVVTTVTLQRIFSVHFLLPFVVVFLVAIHLFFLHQVNSSGEFSTIWNRADRINFYPILLVRDAFIGALVLTAFSINVFFYQDSLGQYSLMAALIRNDHYYYNAICWDNLNMCNTQVIIVMVVIISLFYNTDIYDNIKPLPYLVKIYTCAYEDQSAGNHINSMSSSETTRVIPDIFNGIKKENTNLDCTNDNDSEHFSEKKLSLSNDAFNYWLAGLIDGDGTLGIVQPNTKDVYCIY